MCTWAIRRDESLCVLACMGHVVGMDPCVYLGHVSSGMDHCVYFGHTLAHTSMYINSSRKQTCSAVA